jgi:RNA polymerase sigma factor (sigma-70 family)
VPGALEALQQLAASATTAGIPETTLYMVQLRASQINGCSVCVDIHSRELEHAGESSERIHTVAVWRETPYFSDAERAALALTEAATRLADRPDPVPDEVWDEAARHYSEPQLAALVVAIATINAVQPPQRGHPADHRRVGRPHRRDGPGETSSLDAPRPSDDRTGGSYADTLGEEDERLELIECDVTLRAALAEMPPRDRVILRMRFVEELTQSEIAGRIGVSQMQVSRLLRRSLDRLRALTRPPAEVT